MKIRLVQRISLFCMLSSAVLAPLVVMFQPFVFMAWSQSADRSSDVGSWLLILCFFSHLHVTTIAVLFYLYFYRRRQFVECFYVSLMPWINLVLIAFIYFVFGV